MNDKVCMVTGATSGIGKVSAREIARHGMTLVLVGRNPEKCEAVANEIKQQTGNQSVEWLQADLSSQQEIRHLAEAFQQRFSRLDVLLNNAGSIFFQREESADGIEMTIALNHLNYFLLTNLLLDTIKASAPARIINVSSDAHKTGHIDFADIEGAQSATGWKAYNQSKLANLLFTYELARRLEGTGVTVNALHPGFVASNFGMNNGWMAHLFRPIVKVFGITPEEGAQTSIYLATSPEVEGVSGRYFVRQQPTRSSDASYDEDTARRLWEVSEKMTALQPAEVASS
jgi:NAD(P)-dependent dehydrogenase (short-subunit alcohol dehydrogenase family)